MKLYDEIKHRDWTRHVGGDVLSRIITAERFRRAPVIVVDNVTQYYYAEHQREEWTAEHYPSIAPPFDNFFIETRKPTHVSSSERGRTEWNKAFSRWGAYFQAVRIKPEQVTDAARLATRPTQSEINAMSEAQRNELVPRTIGMAHAAAADVNGWVIYILLFVDGAPACNAILVCRADGSIVCDPADEAMFWLWYPAFDMRDYQYDDVVAVKGVHLNLLHPFLLSLSLLHCKNVHMLQETPEGKEAARAAKIGRPLARYHVLKIDGSGTTSRHGMTPEQTRALPFHIVRGHFKTYTEDRKLFGRLAGTFWWPHHTTGTKEHGVVAKDYEVTV